MTRFDKFLIKNKWIFIPIAYLGMCIHTFFATSVTIDGVALPKAEAGMYGLLWLHVMAFLAVVGAYLLHWLVQLISKIW